MQGTIERERRISSCPDLLQSEERALLGQLARQTAIAQLSGRALSRIPLATLLSEAADMVMETLKVSLVKVLERDSQLWEVRTSVGQKYPIIVGRERKTATEKEYDSCLLPFASGEAQMADYILQLSKSVVIEDLWQIQGAGSEELLARGLVSCAGVVIPRTEQQLPFGVLLACSRQRQKFTDYDVQFLEAIAKILSQAIEQHRSQEELRLLASAVHNAQDSILITNTNLKSPGPEIVFVNPAFTRMTGYSAEDAIGKTPRMLQGRDTDPKVLDRLRQDLSAGRVFYGEAINYRKDGTAFYNGWHIEPIYDSKGEVTHYLAIQRDITDRKKAEEQLYYQAFHDGLTGLANRELLRKQLWAAATRLQQEPGYQLALLFLDLDRFKLINDSLGHLAGDQLLQAIAKRLSFYLNPEDLVARVGGDEFAILLENADKEMAIEVAELIQRELSVPLRIDGQEVFTTASIGIVLGVSEGMDRSGWNLDLSGKMYSDLSQELLRNADIAMYRAKAEGGAKAVVFDQKMYDVCVSRLRLENDLRQAIEQQQLLLHYQPIISLQTGKITGFEALVRWQHPSRGLISPFQFIPVAEETGLIIPLGWWVLREACTQLAHWQQRFSTPLTMSVNLSTKQLSQPDLIWRLDRILCQTKCDRHSLKLEITESAIMENDELVLVTLEKIKSLGIGLSIDDFGTGYSSLSRLHKLPVHTLKIDKSFVSPMHLDRENAEIVRTIVSLAHNLGMDIVAEGVEVAQQLSQLKELNCEYGQGYFFSKPTDSIAASKLLAKMPQW
ncbi:MAG: EAL domain-containing protein [Hormoscilla sp.]